MNVVSAFAKWRHIHACPKLGERYWRRLRRRIVIRVLFGIGMECEQLAYLRMWWVGERGHLL